MAAEECDTPQLFVAISTTVERAFAVCSPAALLLVGRFLISLRADAINDEAGRSRSLRNSCHTPITKGESC